MEGLEEAPPGLLVQESGISPGAGSHASVDPSVHVVLTWIQSISWERCMNSKRIHNFTSFVQVGGNYKCPEETQTHEKNI